MSLPIFQSVDKDIMLLQTNWSSQLNPALSNPILNGHMVPGRMSAQTTTYPYSTPLSVGDNVINHGLGRMMTGYLIVWQSGLSNIYMSGQLNDKTLTLNSSAGIQIGLYVF